MRKRYGIHVWFAAASLGFGLLVGSMIGCVGLEDLDFEVPDYPDLVVLESTDPPDGGEIAADGQLVLTFDGDPGTVTVNGSDATVSGTTATWNVTELVTGEQASLSILWESLSGGWITITLTVTGSPCAASNAPCQTDTDCCDYEDTPCVLGTCGGVCALSGDACDNDGDCCNELPCVNGTCGEAGPCADFDEACQTDEDCCLDFPCVNGVCL